MGNSQNLFPLPYWEPAFWRVPMPRPTITEPYARRSPLNCGTTSRRGKHTGRIRPVQVLASAVALARKLRSADV
jgi:hypothetical protein